MDDFYSKMHFFTSAELKQTYKRPKIEHER